MPKIIIPLTEEEALKNIFRVKPTPDMPRPGNFKIAVEKVLAKVKKKKAAKKKAKK